MKNFEVSVQKSIYKTGQYSIREIDKLVRNGQVKVNSKIIEIGAKCTSADIVTVNDEVIDINSKKKIYIILNKDKGTLSYKTNDEDKKTVFDLINKEDLYDDLVPLFELDKYSTGLIILTNDKSFIYEIKNPINKVKKEYIVYLNKKIEKRLLKKIEDKINLNKNKNGKNQKMNIFYEGQNKYKIEILSDDEIDLKSLFELFQFNVISIRRIKIGNLNLNKLILKPRRHIKYSRNRIVDKILF